MISITNHFILFVLFLLTFIAGKLTNNIFNFNLDVFNLYSPLIFIFIVFAIVLNFLIYRKEYKNTFQIAVILIISSFSIATLLSIVQSDLITTRWFYLGKFPSGDAADYYKQSIDYLFHDQFYTDKGRVLYPIIYAGMLKIFNLNTASIQIFVTLLTSIVVFYSTIEIRRIFGFIPSMIASFLSVDFLHENVGGVCTENIGYILGGTAFILLIKLFSNSKIGFIYFLIGVLLLSLGFLIRPGPIFLLFTIILFAFLYTYRVSKKKSFLILLASSSTIFLVSSLNTVVTENKSPESPVGFSNAVDSWYATIVIGKYVKEGNYDNIPGTLWTQIYKENPQLYEYGGKLKSDNKNKVFINKVLKEPENFIIGSFVLIKNFFQSSTSYYSPHDNTRGFLFIDIVLAQILATILFGFGLIYSIINFIVYKNKISFLIFLVSVSIIFSQPFLFGGESRTPAVIILFLSLVLIYSSHYIIQLTHKMFKKSYMVKEFDVYQNQIRGDNLLLIFTSIPTILLVSIFVVGYNKNILSLERYGSYESNLSCPKDITISHLLFNSKSGFSINSAKDKETKSDIRFENFLNVSSDKTIMFREPYGINFKLIEIMSDEEVNQRDSYSLLTPLYSTVIDKLFIMDKKERNLYKTIGNVYLSGGGFFVEPLNLKLKQSDRITILPLNLIKNGINKISSCM